VAENVGTYKVAESGEDYTSENGRLKVLVLNMSGEFGVYSTLDRSPTELGTIVC